MLELTRAREPAQRMPRKSLFKRKTKFDQLVDKLHKERLDKYEETNRRLAPTSRVLLPAPRDIPRDVCYMRARRRAVLLAYNKVNKPGGAPGKNGKYTRTILSNVRCK